MAKRKAHRFGVFDVRRIRVTGSWSLPMNSDSQVKWTDEEPPERRKDWPEMRRWKGRRA